ncbi:MAG: DNA alkylation repair protein [Methanocellales archaeon]|nr:DNA alkylation repair protein [Methanocellales archaeon]
MSSVDSVVEKLREKAVPAKLEGMARYGMVNEQRMGVSIPEIRKIAKQSGKDHTLALQLWKTGIAEARILASMVDEPEKVTEQQMEDWVKEFNSWDVCDQVCMNLFEKTPFARKKILDWSDRQEEYVKRAAFALIACLAWHDKNAEDDRLIELFSVITRGSTDERNFVKKAVNWALRNIGKRNLELNKQSIKVAKELLDMDSKAARWIARDAIRELESEPVQKRLKK